MVDGLAITVLPMPYHMQATPTPRLLPRREPLSACWQALKPATADSACSHAGLMAVRHWASPALAWST
jgi:hypothetical protein